MVKRIPDRGEIYWASLDPTLGHEQHGRRPVLVLSRGLYNDLSGLVIICPLTSKIKPYPYSVLLGSKGVILTDQIRCISWDKRNFEYITKISPEIFDNILDKIRLLLDL